MTSINAMKFNDYSGIMMCDEQRGWNEEDMKIYVSDKIKPCIPPEITVDTGLVAAYGNTGTSTVGDEIKFTIFKTLREDYQNFKDKCSKVPKQYKTIEELSVTVFDIIRNMKRNHIDQQLKGKFGFNALDYLKGSYEEKGKKVEIKDKDTISQVHNLITWKDRGGDVKPIFLNAGLLAGYDNKEGFRIFHFSLIQFFREAVQVIYLADGSGYDTVNLLLSDYTSHKSLPERRGNIDRVEGSMELLSALNTASRRNVGIGGYYNIILFNGRADYRERMVEIHDHRSKLASEIIYAKDKNLISYDTAYGLIDKILFKHESFEEVNSLLEKNCPNPVKLKRILRGYKK
ncbi:MAG: hypothetical protein ABRQ38_00385 [Candidatus Eremiobacterota bacterium]